MWFYNCGIFFYTLFIRFASLFNHKAALWVKGRRNIFAAIEKTLHQKIKPGSKITWFHCASLGEFEQGRPVLEKLKKSGHTIILTFFSPSGYENRKDYEYADAVFYLPPDFKNNARRFIELVNPQTALFVKYEFWLNYLNTLFERKIPVYLVSGVFRPKQHFFKWYGKNFLKALKGFKVLFVQDENSHNLLKQFGLTNVVLAGDTRFDRVLEIAAGGKGFPEIEKFCNNSRVLITGSSWSKDEEHLLFTFKNLKIQYPDLKLIIVPHEVDKESITDVQNRVKECGLSCSLYTGLNFELTDILIIDTIGMLSHIYRYGILAYVGGGFNSGIHNILEVFAHGVPVAFGPNYHKFIEAQEAEKLSIGKPVHNREELFAFMSELLGNEEKRKKISTQINTYMQSKAGATKIIIRSIADR